MHSILLFFHSTLRWLLLFIITLTTVVSLIKYLKNKNYTTIDNLLRFITVTTAHIQLIIGILLYLQSPTVKYFWNNFNDATQHFDSIFYSLIHSLLMLFAIITLTIGAAKVKRELIDCTKFKTTIKWFGLVLLIIFIAIPWNFSPLSKRPLIRIF